MLRKVLIIVALTAPSFALANDGVLVEYPERTEHEAAPFAVLHITNSTFSGGGQRTIETRHGPVVMTTIIGSGVCPELHCAETYTVLEAPDGMWPVPVEIQILDGETGRIELLPAMM